MFALRVVTVRVWFRWGFIHVLCAYGCFNATPPLSATHPPTANDDSKSVANVPDDKHSRLGSRYPSVSENEEHYAYRDGEETDITEEGERLDFERTNDAHGPCDARNDKGCGTQ